MELQEHDLLADRTLSVPCEFLGNTARVHKSKWATTRMDLNALRNRERKYLLQNTFPQHIMAIGSTQVDAEQILQCQEIPRGIEGIREDWSIGGTSRALSGGAMTIADVVATVVVEEAWSISNIQHQDWCAVKATYSVVRLTYLGLLKTVLFRGLSYSRSAGWSRQRDWSVKQRLPRNLSSALCLHPPPMSPLVARPPRMLVFAVVNMAVDHIGLPHHHLELLRLDRRLLWKEW